MHNLIIRIVISVVPLIVLNQVYASEENQIVWAGNEIIKTFRCELPKDTIIVRGVVTLQHPDDSVKANKPWTITVKCSNMIFEDGGEIHSDSNMYFGISNKISGIVNIKATRGENGQDADPTPDLWKVTKAQSGVTRSPASGGHNAISTSMEYPAGRTCDNGDGGARGDNGQHGASVPSTLLGASGHNGLDANTITLIAGEFEQSDSITLSADGGNGGGGGRGARGQDGGDAANGQAGGGGGSASEITRSCRGGAGGDGGDGGNGGRGGQGGPGGNGGRGGDITVGLKQGSDPPDLPSISARGGTGGRPGVGGEGGDGGKRGEGGAGGRGGDGKLWNPSAPDGRGGKPGNPGNKGAVGALGVPGKDGDNGKIGGTKWGLISAEDFSKLVN